MPHPQSKDLRRQVSSAYELVTNTRPDIWDLIAAPGELVVVDSLGAKASAGRPTGTQCYYIRPCPYSPTWCGTGEAKTLTITSLFFTRCPVTLRSW